VLTIDEAGVFSPISRGSSFLFSRDALHRDSKSASIHTKSIENPLIRAECQHTLITRYGRGINSEVDLRVKRRKAAQKKPATGKRGRPGEDLERNTGLEPATSTLARLRSTS
jgi:hypothetical protein